ncbi:AzlC family ABC transporter permease [Thermus antranikianii]|uniref:AzlC family ABC transporter permease n=1 Tax=Thermus sp. NMX2.A1 TaxID=570924 RepID=UPI0003DBD59B|nr:AzlC family ABC transporter permease [Thermus sp. NMX2.A1]ETN88339.1 transporter [Thermus sp. NMX2.A1]
MGEGLRAAWPIALGYFPVAVAFGALGAQAGLGYLWIQLTSLLVFAGASQFALVGLLAQGVPPLLAASLGLLLNLRHAFYGPALRPYLKGGPLEAFFLTDEVFALALRTLPGLSPEKRRGYFLGLGLGAYLSWNLGTALGALGAKGLLAWPRLGEALAFALPALFLLLALPHLRNPAALLAGGVALGFHLLGQTAWGLFLAGVVGLLWKEPWKGRKA